MTLILIITLPLARRSVVRDLHSEAVERGFAVWEVQYNGDTSFKWKEPTR